MRRFLIVLLLVSGGLLHAQDPAPSEDAAALEAARTRLQTLGQPTTPEEEQWVEAINERIRILRSLIRTADRVGSLDDGSSVDKRTAAAESEIQALRAKETPTTAGLESADELAGFRREAAAAKAGHEQASSLLQEVKDRVEQGRKELDGLPARGTEVRERQQNLSGEGELTKYRGDTVRLEVRLVRERTAYMTRGLEVWNLLTPVLELELDLASLKADRAEALAALAQDEAAVLREAEAQEGREESEAEALRAEQERDPIERFRLRVRSEVGRLRAETTAQRTEIESLNQTLSDEREEIKALRLKGKVLDERLELRPRGAEALLRRTLERLHKSAVQFNQVFVPQLAVRRDENQNQLAEVLDRLWELRTPEAENEWLQELLADVEPARHEEATKAFNRIIDEEGLLDALRDRSAGLEAVDVAYGELATLVAEHELVFQEVEEFVRKSLVWSRSDTPITVGTIIGSFGDLARIPQPYGEGKAWRDLLTPVGPMILLIGAIVALVIGLQVLLRRIERRSAVPAGQAPRSWWDRAGVALVWSIVPPLQLGVVALALYWARAPAAFDPPVAVFLGLQAGFLGLRRLVSSFLGADGVGVGDRGIAPEVGLQIHRSVRIATLAGQVCYAPAYVLSGSPFNFVNLPRLLDLFWLAGIALSVLLLFRWNGAIIRHWTRPGRLTRTLVRFFWAMNAISIVPIFVLEILGYRIGTRIALANGFRIFVALLVLGLLFRLMERVAEEISIKVASRFREGEEDPRAEYRQNVTRLILRISAMAIVVLAAVFLQQFWGLGEPLQSFLASFELVELDSGRWLTPWDIVLALIWVGAGHLVAANLAKINKVIVTPLAGSGGVGGRYATLALIRYALLLAAYSVALLTLGFSFQALGWFLTATSVGIGFGLQEIVANFISGLILLFEGPIRVGDIVTIGNTSGTVDKITIRATVVTNWERQTIIIPNKKFITENLTNWTRNDQVMRRTIDVRVAYGSDVEQVLRILDEIVAANPAVLEDPPHRIWFQSFGQFGIELQIWFFTDIDSGLRTRSEIHAAVNARFALEGIEIPVVQRDLRIGGVGGGRHPGTT